VHDGETVLDVPAKLSAQVRVFATGNGRKSGPVDAHSVAMVALRTPNLVQVQLDADLQVMGMLVDRRDELGRARTQTINRLHRLLLELLPGGAKKFLSARQARTLIATIKPTDIVGKTRDIVGKIRRRLAVELIGELERIDKKIKSVDKDLEALVLARGSTLMGLHGIGPSGAARLLADVGDIRRFADRDRFASWNSRRPAGRLLRCPATPPPVARRQPPHQPDPAHHGRRPTAQPHRRPRLLRREESRREDVDGSHTRPETAPVQRRLRPNGPRPQTTAGSRPGRALGDDSAIQRDRPAPGHRLFGQATSRTHHSPA
jgi:hypothetical protein